MDMEWLKLGITLLTGLAAAGWAVLTWRHEKEKERKDERRRLAALYVNPFLMACEELQSRFYNILCQGGLGPLNKRYPDKSYAEEILYLVAQYFGWERCIYRYSPYAHDAQVINITESIRKDFARDRIGGVTDIGAFCFFRPEQRSLGDLVIKGREGEFGGEFAVMSFAEFKQKLSEPAYSTSQSITDTLNVLRKANKIEDLTSTVRERMVRVQKDLVELLNYMEEQETHFLGTKERFTFFFSDTSKERLTASNCGKPDGKPEEA